VSYRLEMLYIGRDGKAHVEGFSGSKDKLTKWAHSKPVTSYREICVNADDGHGKQILRLRGTQPPF
jgi:hypothetical protein